MYWALRWRMLSMTDGRCPADIVRSGAEGAAKSPAPAPPEKPPALGGVKSAPPAPCWPVPMVVKSPGAPYPPPGRPPGRIGVLTFDGLGEAISPKPAAPPLGWVVIVSPLPLG